MDNTEPIVYSLDGLTKTIEEIFSLRFIKETNLLKIGLSKQDEYGSKECVESFPQFVLEYLRERVKSRTLFNHQSLSMLYSLFLWKKKSFEAEIFSSFLAEEYDNEDLTFFLFVRSIIEKEYNLMFMTSSALNGIRSNFIRSNQCRPYFPYSKPMLKDYRVRLWKGRKSTCGKAL